MELPESSKKVRKVVIADDHAIVRQGTIDILGRIPNIEIAAEADNGLTAISLVKKLKPDLLVLDAAMPMARGIEVYSEVRRWSPETAIMLLTGFTSLTLLSDWLDAGVDGVLLKTCPPEEMQSGFLALLNGSSFVAESVREKLEDAISPADLTSREREVLSLIASGNSNVDIANRLSISPKTVEKHRGSLMSKLEVHTVAELMVFALREGLLDEHKQL